MSVLSLNSSELLNHSLHLSQDAQHLEYNSRCMVSTVVIVISAVERCEWCRVAVAAQCCCLGSSGVSCTSSGRSLQIQQALMLFKERPQTQFGGEGA